MQITQIVVTAGRTFNHPYESYSNLKPGVSLTAVLQSSDDAEQCTRELQAKAEKYVEEHKQLLLAELERRQRMTEAQERASNLETSIKRAQEELDNLRRDQADLFQPALMSGD